jgi:hypothetical protein
LLCWRTSRPVWRSLEESDREYFNLLAMSVVRSVVNATGMVRAVGDLKRHLEGSEIGKAAATVESIEQWLNGIDARWTMLETRYVM